MTLENTFYVIGIIYMSLMTILALAFIISLIALIRKIMQLQQEIHTKVDAISSNLGIKLAAEAVKKVREAISK